MDDDDQNSSEEDPKIPRINRINFLNTNTKIIVKKEIQNKKWKQRIFDDLNGHKVHFKDCDFSYSIFRRGYFRNATFTNCRFVGCQFYDSNFRGTNFYLCDLRFVRFHRCQLDIESTIAALPPEPNIRQELLQNLRANAVEIGDFKSQRPLVLEEIATSKDHYWRAFIGSENHYREKYPSAFLKIGAGWEYLRLNVGTFVWGNGEKPLNIAISGISILLILTIINFYFLPTTHDWKSFFDALTYSISTFFDIDTDQHFNGRVLVDYAIVSLRYIYVGLYISVLYKIISHR